MEESGKADIPNFEVPCNSIIQFSYDRSSDNMFIICNNSKVTGKEASVVFAYKLFNVFSWQFKMDFSRDSDVFQDFQIREADGMTL